MGGKLNNKSSLKLSITNTMLMEQRAINAIIAIHFYRMVEKNPKSEINDLVNYLESLKSYYEITLPHVEIYNLEVAKRRVEQGIKILLKTAERLKRTDILAKMAQLDWRAMFGITHIIVTDSDDDSEPSDPSR